MPRDNEPLGDIATEVLFENERVKIWSLIVEPGQASPGTCTHETTSPLRQRETTSR